MTDNYAPAHWRPSPNFTTQARTINAVIIHDTEGLYEQSIQWLMQPSTQASAHYIIRSSDGDVSQLVHDADVAWHCGNLEYNVRSVGIEHEGFVAHPEWYTDVMLEASAKLVAELCAKYNIPADRAHIIGHSEVPDPNDPTQFGGISHHKDPGAGWPWGKYIQMVQANLNPQPPSGPQPAAWVQPHLVSLEVDGLPLSGELAEVYADVVAVQYTERCKFERHADGSVTRALLGAIAYQQRGK